MAEAIGADLAAGLVRKLVSLATDELIQAWKFHENLDTLRARFELIGALLIDAHTQNLNMSTAQVWFSKLEEVAHLAHAFMDELAYEVTRRKVENHRKVQDFFLPSKNNILYRFKVARKIRDINNSFDKVSKWASDLGLKPVEHLRSTVQQREIRNTPPFEEETLIVGRDKDISFLVNMLTKNDEVLPVNAILGMGGLGKTTLARMVYNNDAVIDMFPKRMWVTVSDDFDFMKILNQMVVSLTSKPSALENAEGLIKDLQKNLKGEKFLLVLDDVWDENPGEWEKLRNSLLGVGGTRGSNVLVTTRRQEVIDAMRCSVPYWVEKLSEEDSWELFKQRAFSDGGVLETEAFAALGKRMVERCGGLPLAVKTLGSLLYSKKTEQEWLHTQNSQLWKSKGVLSSLRLSFDNLPYSSLKQCFAYCSIMPKGSFIYKDKLIQIWMALGFLLGDSNALMEDIGNEYFDILLWNSLLQDVEKDEYGNITKCRMHDLVHDLALDVSSSYSAIIKPSHDFNKGLKPIHLRLEGFEDVKKNIFQEAHLDTVQALYTEASIFNVLLPNLKHLRVLVLNSSCKELPSSITNLKYLKHLDISNDWGHKNTITLPSYITRLFSLQTLRISFYHELPEKVCNLINLRHLVIPNHRRRYMFVGIEGLSYLQTLPYFVVSKDENCLVEHLGGLKMLKGELQLHGLDDVANMEEASRAKLREKSNIEVLVLNWNKNIGVYREDRDYKDDGVMKGLEPHPNLKELIIYCYMGKKFASWITMMNNLVKIWLIGCNRCTGFPSLGQLPKLKKITIQGMENLKVMGNDLFENLDIGATKTVRTMYPSLTTITLYRLQKLEEWVEEVMSTGSDDQSVFPKLESLEITYCPRLRKIPNSCFPSLKELKITDLDSSMILETMSKRVTSLMHLELVNISNGASSSSYCSSMDFIIEEMLKHNSLCLTSLRLIDCGGLNCPHPSNIDLVEGSAGLKDIEIRKCSSSLLDCVFAQTRSSTLERLSLGPFSEDLNEFPWPFSSSCEISFHNLKKLSLDGWKKVESIFGQLDNRLPSTFPALTELRINNFKGVKALSDSTATLQSLKTLHIFDCENLKTLPLFEKSHSLQLLETEGCPLLGEKYKKGQPEWFKIQHIPHIHWEEDF